MNTLANQLWRRSPILSRLNLTMDRLRTISGLSNLRLTLRNRDLSLPNLILKEPNRLLNLLNLISSQPNRLLSSLNLVSKQPYPPLSSLNLVSNRLNHTMFRPYQALTTRNRV